MILFITVYPNENKCNISYYSNILFKVIFKAFILNYVKVFLLFTCQEKKS